MKKLILSSFLLAAALNVGAINKMKVNVSKPGAPVQSTMYGIFFEDINYAADGGLYAELVMNRSFEFPNHFAGWPGNPPVVVSTLSTNQKATHTILQ